MGLWQGKSQRKPSGGRLRHARKKRKFEIGAEAQTTTIGKERKKFARTRARNQKVRVLSAQKANVVIPKKKQVKSTKIISVLENPSNPHYVQRNIITKGAIIQTEIGRARVTSRPGQDGIINAILISK
ncbi:MAG: 30S ribosomal protein S8e [Methanomassiliicoccales archaeon]|nr:MAG: 30S ribosomal protein S8e [Methanomassiliicoccales archaeon]